MAVAGFVIAFLGARSVGTADLTSLTAVFERAGAVFPALGRAAIAGTEQNLTVRIGTEVPEARAERLVAALAEAGYRVEVSRVPFRIGATRIGFFHPEDRAAAEALRAVLAEGERAPELRDYAGVLAAQQPGSLDVWIGG